MAHKTLIGGTAYEISGGKTLVNGTAYSIDNGKTLVDGTAYEVGFKPKTAIITVTSNGTRDGQATVTIDGTTYKNGGTISSNPVTIEVPIGTEIVCYAEPGGYSGIYYGGNIYVNGTVVANGVEAQTAQTYTYTVNGDVTIEVNGGRMGYYVQYGEVYITEE